ncbi:signal peptidase I [Candidatus Saccharibacteria bacterium RIFCSPHIGHO2_12_FULL_47_16b]|nr:MAG: signal peptidase I [Candidatus Saccharibacteria bacterium RIFCSPHIGHO2_12_FULL_47_16b]OGL38391.1 MAG: signal peptidase I [Candidatus Saccharibacteria bacterium RIFCSPLOWO2_02_FULL_46_7]
MVLILLAPLIALFISAFVLQSYQVDGQSMEPTLANGDRLIVNKVPRTISRLSGNNYTPARGDIVIFNQSGVEFGFSQPKQLIKRVIGLPGEHLIVKDGVISVINRYHPDGYNPDIAGDYRVPSQSTPGDVDVELDDNEIFVVGDNRANSEDSRHFGSVNQRHVIGKLMLRLLPLGQPHRID